MPEDKSYGPSRSFEVLKLSKLIHRYLFERDDSARIEILNYPSIEGYSLTEALAYIKQEIKSPETEKTEKDRIRNLISNLELISKYKNPEKMSDELQKIIINYKGMF